MSESRIAPPPEEGLITRWVGDGRPLLVAGSGALIFAGGFAIFLALTGDFLPHDVHYLGMTAEDLCSIECRAVDFMIHDRASWGGALVSIGVLYLWLVTFPLSRGERWAWWTLAATASLGFVTFLSYLGYGYLDTWHGIGTLLLLPVFAVGMVRSKQLLVRTTEWRDLRSLLAAGGPDRATLGLVVLLMGAVGTAVGGLIILTIGITDVFVPEDLHFIGLTAAELRDISPRLVPLIAHDRAGFGGAVFVMGLTTALMLWFGRPSRSLFQAIGIAGTISLVATFVIHFVVGYQDPWHLTPPVLAASSLVIGELLAFPKRPVSGASMTEQETAV